MSGKVEAVKSLFDQPDWYFKRRAHDIRIRIETIKDLAAARGARNILDIGCGDGSISRSLLTPDTRLTLLDLASNMLAIATSKISPELRPNVAIRNEDFMQAEFEPRSFDLILCIGVVAHVVSVPDFLAKVVRLLKPGGAIIMECSDASHFMSRLITPIHWVKACMGRKSKYALNVITYAQIAKVLAEHELYPQATFRYSVPPPGIHRVFSQGALYKINRGLYGTTTANRNAWLGNEYLSLFARS